MAEKLKIIPLGGLNEIGIDYLVGSTIQFTNTSAISGTCTWDFGDGETSTDVNPTHTYSLPDVYKRQRRR